MLTLKIFATIALCIICITLAYQAVQNNDKPILCVASAIGILAVIVAIAGVWNG